MAKVKLQYKTGSKAYADIGEIADTASAAESVSEAFVIAIERAIERGGVTVRVGDAFRVVPVD